MVLAGSGDEMNEWCIGMVNRVSVGDVVWMLSSLPCCWLW